MNLLVVDPDPGIRDFYQRLFQAEFRTAKLTFANDLGEAKANLINSGFDVVLTEGNLSGLFAFIEDLTKSGIPCIVVSSDTTERLIVEAIRAGALDFLSKPNIKLGYFTSIVARALLEAEKWRSLQTFKRDLPDTPEFLKYNDFIRSALVEEQTEQKRNQLLHQGFEKINYVEGKEYYISVLFAQVRVHSAVDDNALMNHYKAFSTQLRNIAEKYGGDLWSAVKDACLVAFPWELPCLLAAIELKNGISLRKISSGKSLTLHAGMASGPTIYRENKGQIYSDAVNFSAHLALKSPDKNTILADDGFYKKLGHRSKKYFFKRDALFENKVIHEFERIG